MTSIIIQPNFGNPGSQPEFNLAAVSTHATFKMASHYDSSKSFIALQTINGLITGGKVENLNPKQSRFAANKIRLDEIKYDQNEEYFSQFYENLNYFQEMRELTEYYKFYTSDPVLYFRSHHGLMATFYQRKKAYLYNKLKILLNLSDSQSQSGKSVTISHPKLHSSESGHETNMQNFTNILSSMSSSLFSNQHTRPKDESHCFQKLRNKLIKHYGPSKSPNMNTIDNAYNFAKLDFDPVYFYCKNAKVQGKEKKKMFQFKKLLQSTNTSTSHVVLNKMKKAKNSNGSSKCRYQSCLSPYVNKITKRKKPAQVKNIRRWNSVENHVQKRVTSNQHLMKMTKITNNANAYEPTRRKRPEEIYENNEMRRKEDGKNNKLKLQQKRQTELSIRSPFRNIEVRNKAKENNKKSRDSYPVRSRYSRNSAEGLDIKSTIARFKHRIQVEKQKMKLADDCEALEIPREVRSLKMSFRGRK